MHIFLDSANLEEVQSIANVRAVRGVTTNPSLMAKEEGSKDLVGWERYVDSLSDIYESLKNAEIGDRHLSVEVLSENVDEMYEQAVELRKLFSTSDKVRVYVKVPVTFDNLELITSLRYREYVYTNATACMTAMQAKLASDNGADFVSFFYNRMIDGSGSRSSALQEISGYRELTGTDRARVICGSIRRPEDVDECFRVGADAVTVSMDILKKMLYHPKTEEAIRKFSGDIKKWLE